MLGVSEKTRSDKGWISTSCLPRNRSSPGGWPFDYDWASSEGQSDFLHLRFVQKKYGVMT